MARKSEITREEEMLVRLRLMAHRAFGAMVENRRGGSEEAQKDLDAIDWAIATIQSKIARPQPDPITGLVPCGCGGKAQLGELQYTIADPDLMPEYYAYCQDCGITTENSADRERVEAAWNRAMGRASE
jgi:hypothetical protein